MATTGNFLTPQDKQILLEAMKKGALTYATIDLVKDAHGGNYPDDFHEFVSQYQPEVFQVQMIPGECKEEAERG